MLHALMDVIDQDDGVAHHQTSQADDADEGGEAEWVVGDEQAESSSGQGQRNRGHDDERIGQGAELEQQDEEDQQPG